MDSTQQDFQNQWIWKYIFGSNQDVNIHGIAGYTVSTMCVWYVYISIMRV